MPKSTFLVRLVRKRFTVLVTNAGSHGVNRQGSSFTKCECVTVLPYSLRTSVARYVHIGTSVGSSAIALV